MTTPQQDSNDDNAALRSVPEESTWVPQANSIAILVNGAFLLFTIIFLGYSLMVKNPDAFAAFGLVGMFSAFPLGLAGFFIGAAARWGGHSGRIGEILGLATICSSLAYIMIMFIAFGG